MKSKIIGKIEKFAKGISNKKTNLYQEVAKKIEKDNYIGKLAEEILHHYLNGKGKGVCSCPDFSYWFHGSKNDRWQSDLQFNDYPIAVKSIRLNDAQRWGYRFAFNVNDPILTSPKNNEIVYMVAVDEETGNRAILLGWCYASVLNKYNLIRFHEGKDVSKWKNTKRFLHLEEVLNVEQSTGKQIFHSVNKEIMLYADLYQLDSCSLGELDSVSFYD